MKKVLSILAVMVISITASAQAPFTTFEPATVPQRSYSSPSLPSLFPDADAMEERMIRRKAAEAQAREIVSSEIITVDAFNYVSEIFCPMKVKIINRRNGQTEYYCLGIKKNGSWSVCEKQIVPLETIYKQATSTADKNKILGLMEYGNYLLVIGNTEAYLIK